MQHEQTDRLDRAPLWTIWIRWFCAALLIFSISCYITYHASQLIDRSIYYTSQVIDSLVQSLLPQDRLGARDHSSCECSTASSPTQAITRWVGFVGYCLGLSLTAGGAVALLTGVYLRRALPRQLWRWWVLVTLIGVAGCMAVLVGWFNYVPYRHTFLIDMAAATLAGSIIGFAQWYILRQTCRYAYVWIFAVGEASALVAYVLVSILYAIY